MNNNANKPIKETLDLEHTKISSAAKEKLKEILKQASPLQEKEVNILHLTLQTNDNDDLVATILIQNGTNQPLDFKQIPLMVHNKAGHIITKGTFSLEGLIVQPFTSKPATFIFPATSIEKLPEDLSAYIVSYAGD